jgi:hypothetical protein
MKLKLFPALIGVIALAVLGAVATPLGAQQLGTGVIGWAAMAPGGGAPQFTITSGCGTVSSLKGGATAGSFSSTQSSCVPIIALPTAPNGWVCYAVDITSGHAVVATQTGSSTASCTVSLTITSGDTVQFVATPF